MKSKKKADRKDKGDKQLTKTPAGIQKGTKTHVKPDNKTDKGKFLFMILCVVLVVGFVVFLQYESKEITTEDKKTKTHVEIPDYTGKEVSFEESFELLLAIDESYGANYHDEQLAVNMIKPGIIPQILEEVDTARQSIAASIGPERNLSLRLFDFRYAALRSQLYFQRALRYGVDGAFTPGFDCDKKERLFAATELYNQSATWGMEASKHIDFLLAAHVPARKLIGTDENKPRWFGTPSGEILRLVDVNYMQYEEYCELDGKNVSNPPSDQNA